MDLFPISELQRFSGIKAHTIRMWEQRYNALQPARSEGNTRYYSGEQLRRLLNIVSLMGKDIKISQLCAMSDEDLHQLLEDQLRIPPSDSPDAGFFISQMIAAALNYDEAKFNQYYGECLQRMGMRDTYKSVLYPALVRLGLMWAGFRLRPAHEHFITHLIRQKILAAVDQLSLSSEGSVRWLLFLPEDEFHETGLLFAHYLLRHAGHDAVYLGANVPLEAVRQAAHETRASHLLFFLVSKNDTENDISYLEKIQNEHPKRTIYCACDAERLDKSMVKSVKALHHIEDLERIIS